MALLGFVLAALPLAAILLSHFVVRAYSGDVFEDPANLPGREIGLLLGTAKYAYGLENRFYNHRIDAAVELYRAGKIQKILVSGDNSRKEYDEPTDIRNDLIAAGVKEEDVFLDYAGFSTLDSILRAKKVFRLRRFTIISQRFHCERALYIAGRNDLDAVGFAAKDVSGPVARKVYLREYLARVKAVLDTELLKRQPRFLGEDPYHLGS